MSDELQKHLDAGMYGTPRLNPAEQQKYLGTFRERCYVSMTVAEMKKKANKDRLIEAFSTYKDAKVLINGKISSTLQTEYIHLVTKYQMPFTIVTDTQKSDPDSFGLLLIADTAVNEEVIDIEEKFNKQTESEEKEDKHDSFWKKFFH